MNKFDAYIIRFLGAFVPIVTYVMFTSLISLNREVMHLDDIKANKINVLTLASYIAIEQGRAEVVSELFVDFGRMIRVKEDELDPFRIVAAKKLNRSIRTGTTRGGR